MKILAVILICLIPAVSYAGNHANSPLPSFDLSTGKLPKKYNGHNLQLIYRDLAKIQSKISKSEFENTVDHASRVGKIKNKLKLAALPLNSTFAFKVKDLTYTYDADQETFDLTLDTQSVRDDRNQIVDSRVSVEGFKVRTSHGQYPASNAFGATVLVNKYEIESVNLMPANPRNFSKTYSIPKINPSNASNLSKNVAAIIIYQIDNLNLYGGILYGKATFVDPTDFLGTTYYIEAEIKDIWIYDYLTGDILLKASNQQ